MIYHLDLLLDAGLFKPIEKAQACLRFPCPDRFNILNDIGAEGIKPNFEKIFEKIAKEGLISQG